MSSKRGGRGGGRGGGGGGGGGGGMPREKQVSKKISWLLRHGAEKEGLKLGSGGYVGVKDAVSYSASTYILPSLYYSRASRVLVWFSHAFRIFIYYLFCFYI